MHETEAYKLAMFRDLETLGYDREMIEKRVRLKRGSFFWNPTYRIKDDKGNVLKLAIKDLRNGCYIDLNNCGMTLNESQQFIDSKGYLLAEGDGWELNLPFGNKNDLLAVSNLFLKKAGLHIYNKNGIEVDETNKECLDRGPWPDAYEVPVLIIGNPAIKYFGDLLQFDVATKISLIENDNEISFIIHNKLDFLKRLEHYDRLIEFGCIEEKCLANKPFLMRIDNIR